MGALFEDLNPELQSHAPDGVWLGEFAASVANYNDPAYVIIHEFGDDGVWGPCKWQSRGADSGKPSEGDHCVVVFDSDRQPWVVAWWPAGFGSIGSGVTVGSSPPSSPKDGDLWMFPADVGVTWQFLYDSSEPTYKWEFVGGPSMTSQIDTDETYTTGLSFQDASTVGPSITLPRAGDYEYDISAQMYTTGVGDIPCQIGLKLGSVGPSAPDVAAGQIGASGANLNTVNKAGRALGMNASDVLLMRYQCGTGTAHTRYRILRVRPIRVI